MAYTKEQAARGLLMLEYDDVQEKCEEIIEAGSESAVSRNLQEEIRALDLPEISFGVSSVPVASWASAV